MEPFCSVAVLFFVVVSVDWTVRLDTEKSTGASCDCVVSLATVSTTDNGSWLYEPLPALLMLLRTVECGRTNMPSLLTAAQ